MMAASSSSRRGRGVRRSAVVVVLACVMVVGVVCLAPISVAGLSMLPARGNGGGGGQLQPQPAQHAPPAPAVVVVVDPNIAIAAADAAEEDHELAMAPQVRATQDTSAFVLTVAMRNALDGILPAVVPALVAHAHQAPPPGPAAHGSTMMDVDPPEPLKPFLGNGSGGTRPVLLALNAKIQAKTTVKVHSLPGANPSAIGLAVARAQIRGTAAAPIADPAFMAPVVGPQLGPITYTVDPMGRVSEAFGPVILPAVARPANSQEASDYCDVLYDVSTHAGDPLGFGNGFNARSLVAPNGRTTIQSGHVIGWAIGGNSDDPLNFYPQHVDSNNQGGRWGRIERIALIVKRNCLAHVVNVRIRFGPAWTGGGVNALSPADGTYSVLATQACYVALGCAPGVGSNNFNSAWLHAFCRHAICPLAPNPLAGQCYLTTPFSNDANDKARRPGVVPPAPLAARPADANLFP